VLAQDVLAALLHVQEHGGRDHGHGHGHGHGPGWPHGPKPHDPPPPVDDPPPVSEEPEPTPEPEPEPVPQPAPQPAPVVVVDDPAPARFLESVRQQLRSDLSEVPFSKRNAKPPAAAPVAPAGLGAFYTPGVFTPAQAGAMRAVAQGQAGLALLQAAQMSHYAFMAAGPDPFRTSTSA
jgi:outer membrane biosynthesis protein TonB